ncbi:MAG TPA: hypothetical protein VF756_28115 [Thermoanaerobaculia bacterium]
MDGEWWIVAIVIGYLAFTGWMIQIVVSFSHRRTRLRSEERLRILERFGTGEELATFLNSVAGEKLLSGQPAYPVRTIAWTTALGIVLLFLGGAFLLLSDTFLRQLVVPGMILAMTGGGVLVSAAVSTLLYRRAGLLPRQESEL